ncbi:hypothetical protein THEYE_A2028 [Thermodesulfovibrio yellowstonii DSM 11347]|uniref:Uncharacterized protein n=1 Tax=Thermodesulfovibrio yellowstonii (strain ATCC 51303 / DSM 11347 / YP87) TaxID=289376 RepID=B5YIU1_THEYD|nr:hypothetical protein THEYE_A2028 [Thermodesulfovibrio yellowstonii DSM 11347]
MVQMKPVGSGDRLCWKFDFISHMVQMKHHICKKIRIVFSSLYIPHGSDETMQKDVTENMLKNFISHMVQMKPTGQNVTVDEVEIFISHMVQMKHFKF